ncbi:MAG TPA: hypothetical protein DDZ81_18320, partial [Acetobacteraceae bacterium]|nr:hypothetical protein [Acetobacteraceae bacterium]
MAGAESLADGGRIVVVSGRRNDSRHGHDDAAHGPPWKKFQAFENLFPETAPKTSRNSAQRRRSQPDNRASVVVAPIAGGYPPVTPSIGRRF